MQKDLTVKNKFLAKIGLKMKLEWIINDKDDFILNDESKFKCFPIHRSKKSPLQKEMDHVYGMSDIGMMHIDSGLRMLMTIHET